MIPFNEAMAKLVESPPLPKGVVGIPHPLPENNGGSRVSTTKALHRALSTKHCTAGGHAFSVGTHINP